jgi:hypothetical protein
MNRDISANEREPRLPFFLEEEAAEKFGTGQEFFRSLFSPGGGASIPLRRRRPGKKLRRIKI